MRSSLLALGVLIAGVAWAGKPQTSGAGGPPTAFVAGYTLTEASMASVSEAKGAWRDEAKAVFLNAEETGTELRATLTDTKTGAKLSLAGTLANGRITGKYGPSSVCEAGGAATGTFVLTMNTTQAGARVVQVSLDGASARVDKVEQTASKLPGNLSSQLTGTKTCQ